MFLSNYVSFNRTGIKKWIIKWLENGMGYTLRSGIKWVKTGVRECLLIYSKHFYKMFSDSMIHTVDGWRVEIGKRGFRWDLLGYKIGEVHGNPLYLWGQPRWKQLVSFHQKFPGAMLRDQILQVGRRFPSCNFETRLLHHLLSGLVLRKSSNLLFPTL